MKADANDDGWTRIERMEVESVSQTMRAQAESGDVSMQRSLAWLHSASFSDRIGSVQQLASLRTRTYMMRSNLDK